MSKIESNINGFYNLLLEEEKALVSLDLESLSRIRAEKSEYLSWLESLLRNKEDLMLLDKDFINKIKKKNLVLANLYKFSLSLFKKDDSYGNKRMSSLPSLSIKA